MTMVFCDLVESTALASRLDPEELAETIGAYRRCVAEAVARFDGFVAQHSGDGALAYFGYPHAHEDDAERAVRAALAVIDAVERLSLGGGDVLRVRIGVASGLVVAGDIAGGSAALERDVVGETPNLAARLQAVAGRNQVVVAPGTRKLIGGLFRLRDLSAVALKGFSEPVRAWEVLGARGSDTRFGGLRAGSLTPLVGRGEEMAALLGLWDEAERGHGRVAFVAGEPGIGKSRLALALQHRLRRTPHTRLRLSGSPYHGNSPLHPVIEYLDRAAGQSDAAGDEAKRQRLAALLSPVSPTEEEFRLLAGLLAIPLPAPRSAPQDSAERTKEKTFEAVLRHIEVLARREPLLIVVEDAQWIDPTSRELLELAVERVAGWRALLLVTARPEFQPTWRGWPQVHDIVLDRLDQEEAIELASHIAGAAEVSVDMLAQITAHAEGVPLYIEELTRAALEADEAPARSDGTVVREASSSCLPVPGAVRASLIARFDRLGRTTLEVAQVASVLGREFSSDIVQHVFCWNDAAALERSLRDLGDAGLVFRRQLDRQDLYAFRHALIQDAVYSTLLLSRRKQLHAQVVSCLEESCPEVARREPELLAHHCTLAGLIEPAVDYWLRAGRQATRKSAYVEAIAHLQNGLRLMPLLVESDRRLAKELDLQTALGTALTAARGFGDLSTGKAFARAHELCLTLCQVIEDVASLFYLYRGQFLFHLMNCDFDAVQAVVVQTRQLATRTANPALAIASDYMMGVLCLYSGDFTTALDHLRGALASCDAEAGQRHVGELRVNLHGLVLSHQAWGLLAVGRLDEAYESDRGAVLQAQSLQKSLSSAGVLCFSCCFSLLLGDHATVAAKARALLALCAEQKFPFYMAVGSYCRGWVLSKTGEIAEGLAVAKRGMDAYQATGAKVNLRGALTMLADILLQCGQAEEAVSLMADTVQRADIAPDRWLLAENHRILGRARLATGDASGARSAFETAIAVARAQGAKLWEQRAAADLAGLRRNRVT